MVFSLCNFLLLSLCDLHCAHDIRSGSCMCALALLAACNWQTRIDWRQLTVL